MTGDNILYRWKFSLAKNFAKPRYLYIAELFGGINFRQCDKGHHILYVIINTGQKFMDKKFRQREQVAKLAKIFTYAVARLFKIGQEASDISTTITQYI